MNLSIRKWFLGASFLMLLASCKKVLEVQPEYEFDVNARFQNLDDHEYALTGAYRLFRQANYYGAGSNAYAGLPDMLSDNLNETTESLGNFTTLSTWRYAEDEPNIDGTWQAAYRIIAQSNLTLRGIDQFSAAQAGSVNRIKAQAMAIRGLVHFDVLRYWAEDFARNSARPGVPYMTSFDFEQKPGRGTVKETYDKIEADLKGAKELMRSMDRPINTGSSRAYIDSSAVNAVLARMYLYAGVWDSAIAYSSRVINAIPLASRTDFPLIWQDASTAEVVWSVAFNAGEGRIGDNIYFVPNNRSSYRPNPTLVATYDAANDVRFPAYFQTRSSRRVLSKYLAKQAAQTRPDGVVDFKAFRTGEMYLIRSEAYARRGDEALALDDLNTLRSARIAGFTPGTEGGAALLSAIALERRKELIGEGHRWFDLKRTTRTINRANCTNFCTLGPDNRAWAWPIPLTELNANPSMVQNPGY